MNEIGFDAASIGVMAAAYAAVVPIVEVPSGILADRWSRRGVLVVASAALAVSALIGGLSNNVPTYIVSALVLGVYFAMYSGTMDSSSTTPCWRRPATATHSSSASAASGSSRAPRWWRAALAGGWLAGLDEHPADVPPDRPVRRAVDRRASCGSASRGCTGGRAAPRCAARSRVTYRTLTRRRPAAADRHAGRAERRSSCRCCWSSGRCGWSRWRRRPCCTGRTGPASMSTLGLGGLLAGQAPPRPPGALGGVAALMIAGQPGADHQPERRSS